MTTKAENNLDLFRIFYLIWGILQFAFSLIPLLYATFGGAMFGIIGQTDPDIPVNPGIFFIVIGGGLFLLYIALGVLNIYVSTCFTTRKNYSLIFGMAIVNCITGGMIGIGLGVATLIVIHQPDEKALFGRA